MALLNLDERWMYRGSSTTPPCEGDYLWNVLATVYPISAECLQAFKGQLRVNSGSDDLGGYNAGDAATYAERSEANALEERTTLDTTGNYRDRGTSEATAAHQARYVRKTPGAGLDSEGFGPTVVFLGCLTTVLACCTIFCTFKYNKRETERFEKEKAAKEGEGA